MYGIIGAGNVGATFAELLVAADREVVVANSRGPETLGDFVDSLGDKAEAEDVDGVIERSDVVIEAVPYKAVDTFPADKLAGKILISASNYFPGRDGDIDFGGKSQTERVAELYPETSVAKAFNIVHYEDLAERGEPEGPLHERRVVPYVANNEPAQKATHELIDLLDFAPLYLGGLGEAAELMEPGGPLFDRDLTYMEAKRMIEDELEA